MSDSATCQSRLFHLLKTYRFINENVKMPSNLSLLITAVEDLGESLRLLMQEGRRDVEYLLWENDELNQAFKSTIRRMDPFLLMLNSRVPKFLRDETLQGKTLLDKKKMYWFRKLYLRFSFGPKEIQKLVDTVSERRTTLVFVKVILNTAAPEPFVPEPIPLPSSECPSVRRRREEYYKAQKAAEEQIAPENAQKTSQEA